jgi:hypothetical protein
MKVLEEILKDYRSKLPSSSHLRSVLTELGAAVTVEFLQRTVDASFEDSIRLLKVILILEQLIEVFPETLENQDLVVLAFKLLAETSNYQNREADACLPRLVTVFRLFAAKSTIFGKMIRAGLRKFDVKGLNSRASVLGPALVGSDVIEALESCLREKLAALEEKSVVLHPDIFKPCSSSFLDEILVALPRRLMKKSLDNVSRVALLLSGLNIRSEGLLPRCEDLLESYLLEGLSKSGEVIRDLFKLLEVLLCRPEGFQTVSKVEAFISGLLKRVFRNQNEEIHVLFCRMASKMNYAIDDRIASEVIGQLFESFSAVKEAKLADLLMDEISKNASIMTKPSIATSLIEKERFKTHPALAFRLLRAFHEKKSLPDSVRELYIKALESSFERSMKSKLISSNYQNALYSLDEWVRSSERSNDVEAFAIVAINRDSPFATADFWKFAPAFDAGLLLECIASTNDEVWEGLSKGQSEAGSLLGYLLNRLANHHHGFGKAAIEKLSEFKLRAMLTGVYSMASDSGEAGQMAKLRFALETALNRPAFKFDKNDQALLSKLFLVLGSPGFIQGLHLKKLLKSAAFKSLEEDSLSMPDLILLLFSRHNLFSVNEFDRQKASELLTAALFLFPNLIVTFASFLSVKILSYLQRADKVLDLVSGLEGFSETAFLEKIRSETQAVAPDPIVKKGGKGGAAQPKHVVGSELPAFKATLQRLIEIEANEDENFEEKSYMNRQSEIVEAYRMFLEGLFKVLKTFFKRFSGKLNSHHQKSIKSALAIIYPCLSECKFLSEYVFKYYGLFFKHSGVGQGSAISPLVEFFTEIKGGGEGSALSRRLEHFIKGLSPKDLPDGEDVFKLLFELLQFSFKSRIDGEYQRKLFKIVNSRYQAFPAQLSSIFNFFCSNLNDLYFEEAFDALSRVLKTECEQNNHAIDSLMKGLLAYEEFAAAEVAHRLLDLSKAGLLEKQVISPIQKLKLQVLADSEIPKLAELGKQVLASHPIFTFDAQSFESLSFIELLQEFPFDMQDSIARLLRNQLVTLNAEARNEAINKLLAASTEQIAATPVCQTEEMKEVELQLKLLPKLLTALIDLFSEKQVVQVFELIFSYLISNRKTRIQQSVRELPANGY